MRASRTLIAAVALVALLASCGADAREGGEGPAGATPTGTGTPSSPGSTSLQTADNRGAWDLVPRDVRVGEHEGYDRIVLELEGTGTPGWAVRYVEEAVLEGSGDVVAVDGDAILQLDVSGTTLPVPGADDPQPPGPAGHLVDVHVGGTFEGYTQVFVGVEGGRAPFRVFALTGPPRLVVDVYDDAA